MKLSTSYFKVYFVFTLILLTFSLIASEIAVRADSETVVKVNPQTVFAKVGKTVTINITVVNVQNIYGLEVTLYWNPSVLKIVFVDIRLDRNEHPDGVLFSPLEIYKNETSQEKGRYIISASSYAPASSFNGSGNIVRLTFEVIGFGDSELALNTKLVSNIMTPTGAKPIEHMSINGFYHPIKISASPKTIDFGENTSIFGAISLNQANIEVKIMCKLDGEKQWTIIDTVATEEDGTYSYTWTPMKSGKYYIKGMALVSGVEGTSPEISVDVNEPYGTWLYIIILVAVVVVIVILLVYFKTVSKGQKRLKR